MNSGCLKDKSDCIWQVHNLNVDPCIPGVENSALSQHVIGKICKYTCIP